MPHLRRPPVSQGQPAPAGLEPGPQEWGEAERAAADDRLREAMQQQAERAQGIAELAPPGLLEDPTLRLYRLQSGQYRHAVTAAGNVPIGGENQLAFPEEVHAGEIFIIRGIRALAPAGARLLLYQDAVTPTNFREVITSVQQFSGEPPGTLVIRGPSRLIAVITNTTAEGLAMVRLEGDLVKREPVVP
jgi:hypothetical protein